MARHFSKDIKSSGLDLISLLRKRRSIRAFRSDPVPEEKLNAIIAAGQHAPSGAHRHPWLCKLVTDYAVKRQIREKCELADKEWHKNAEKRLLDWLNVKHITTEKRFLTDAPALIAVFGDTRSPYWLESIWICIGYMMLAAVDQGLGSVTYTPGNKDFMNQILGVQSHYDAQAVLPVGYPLIVPQSTPKKQTEKEYDALLELERSEKARTSDGKDRSR